MKVLFSATVECGGCKGTGLYSGMAERGGAAVVCSQCRGTGSREVKHEYTQFVSRKPAEGVVRVYRTAGGYGISANKVETKEGETINFHLAGCSYADWDCGAEPAPIYDLHCPLEHYCQGTVIGEDLKNNGPCREKLTIGGYIPECSRANRGDCWEWFAKKDVDHARKES